MDCVCRFKATCAAATVNSHHKSIYTLSGSYREIVEIDGATGLIVSKIWIPGNSKLSKPHLKYYKRSLYLISGYSQLIVFDTNTNEYSMTLNCGGSKSYHPSTLCFSENLVIFSTSAHSHLYIVPLDTIMSGKVLKKPLKISLPPKVSVKMILAQPLTEMIVAACSDGLIRVWNILSTEEATPILDVNRQPLTKKLLKSILKSNVLTKISTIRFNEDGVRLLAGDEGGSIYVWRTEDLERE